MITERLRTWLKKTLVSTGKRKAVVYLVGEDYILISITCLAVGLSRASYYKKSAVYIKRKRSRVMDAAQSSS
ncbi:MAG TPA: hypothetical protein PL140_08535 [Ferrovaceae bacterium]|nr:hypothetical protein [Ferrovaceae bacterium]